MPAIGATLGSALFGAVDKFRSNPVAQGRKYLQNALLIIFASWLIMSLYGRRLAAEGEPDAEREFDVSEWVDAKLGEPLEGSSGDAGAGGSGDSGGAGGSGGSPEANRKLGQAMAAQEGWTGQEWAALEELWTRESGWNHRADNPTSSAYGIPQRLGSVHGMPKSYVNSPRAQISWGIGYIKSRYGTPSRALQFHNANGWY